MRFVLFMTEDGVEIAVNPLQVMYVLTDYKGVTTLRMPGGDDCVVRVKGTEAEVIDRLQRATDA